MGNGDHTRGDKIYPGVKYAMVNISASVLEVDIVRLSTARRIIHALRHVFTPMPCQ
jgi:hypothetical protein